MEQIVFEATPETEVIITQVSGDLRLFGWEQNRFQAEASQAQSLRAEQSGNRITLSASDDCTVRVPRQTRLTVERVSGDARLKSLDAPLTIEAVSGDLTLRQTQDATINTVSGDLSAKKIAGALRVRAVSGDVAARGVAGEFSAESISGDLYLRDVTGPARADVTGDIVLSLDFAPEQVYAFEASGDILCRLAPTASVQIEAEASGEIAVSLPGAKVVGDESEKTITLGEGAARVTLDASGDITLTGLASDPEAMGEFGEHFGEEFGVMAEEFAAQIESQVEAQIEQQMADFTRNINSRFAGLNFGGASMNAEAIAARAREAAERASEKIRRKGEAAQRRAEGLAEAARRREEAARRREEAAHRRAEQQTERSKRRMAFAFTLPPSPPSPPRPPAPPVDPVSDEERMSILRMVEQKKISVADAEKLLAALENK